MRKRKLSFSVLSNMLATENNGYFKFSRAWYDLENKKIPGYMYTLEKQLSDNIKTEINSFDNTIISSCCYRYAPEIKHDCVFLADKCFSSYIGKEG